MVRFCGSVCQIDFLTVVESRDHRIEDIGFAHSSTVGVIACLLPCACLRSVLGIYGERSHCLKHLESIRNSACSLLISGPQVLMTFQFKAAGLMI